MGLDGAANIGCTKPAVQTNRHMYSERNHNGSKGSKLVTEKSVEFQSDLGPKDTAAEVQGHMLSCRSRTILVRECQEESSYWDGASGKCGGGEDCAADHRR